MKHKFYCIFFKRFLDIIFALIGIIIFSWLYVVLAVLVRFKLGSPIIFKQKRPGKIDEKTGKESIFTLYKFRSMTNKKDKDGKLLSDDMRLTKFGRLLRSTSLDEIPEIINILKGDMSFVGPRPLLIEYLPYYTDEERKRHLLRPGLTGLAQVNGRNASSWEKKFEYDLKYIKECSLFLDIKILFKTVKNVIKRSDILVGSEIPAGRLDDARKNKL